MADFAASTPEKDESDAIGAAARDQLRALVARIERLEEDKAGVAADIKEVYAEAKSMGYDTKVLRKVISLRKQDAQQGHEVREALWGLARSNRARALNRALDGLIDRSID